MGKVKRKVHMKEVAALAAVSISSVSRVLNGYSGVSPSTRKKVLTAIKELGYEPDFLAKSLREGTTKSVGFVVRDIANPLFAEIIKGAEEVLRSAGYVILISDSEGDIELETHYLRVFTKRRLDGLILSLQSETHQPTNELLESIDIPIVFIDRIIPGVRASAVLSDHASGVFAAVQELLSLGHQHIGFIGGPKDLRATRDRFKGYQDALLHAGKTVEDEYIFFSEYTKSFGYRATQEMMRINPRPTAILAAGAQLTVGVIEALYDLKLAIGEDVSLISCDEIDLMAYMNPPISVIWRDARALGKIAGELLMDTLLYGRQPKTVVMPTTYIRRSSVQPPRF
jgi:LacI family transcriptional regulator